MIKRFFLRARPDYAKALYLPSLFLLAASACLMAEPVPLQDNKPVPVESLRVNNPAVLPMTGTWKFQLTHGVTYEDERFCQAPVAATASSYQGDNVPEAAADGNKGSRWMAKDGFPQWWQLDMGSVLTVKTLNLTFEAGPGAKYQFKVEGSADAQSWNVLADLTPAPGVGEGAVKFDPSDCRYLRITFVDARDERKTAHPACIREATITVLRNGVETRWHPESTDAELAQANAFKEINFQDNDWKDIPVPTNWEMEGFSKPTYNEPDDAVGLYRRWVDVPANFAGQKVLWHFDGVFDGAEVFVNGVRVGYHESGFTAFDVDVTPAIKPGQKNLFAVRVCKNTFSDDLDTGDFWSLGGIYRENYLVAVPPLHVEDVRIITDLGTKYVDAQLKTAVDVQGTAGQAFHLAAHLYSWDRTDAGAPEMAQDGQIGADGKATLDLSGLIKNPKLWSAEKPNLYYLVLSLSQAGGQTENVQERFGFHQLDIRGGVVLWNGVPIKTTGTCRHEEWAALGHALNEQAWQKDVALIKDANINAVRTSHYNHAQRFLEICEEKGLYILDEVPGCWCDPRDPAYKPAWLLRTRETFARDKNRPCVLAWSIGNESGHGPSNIAAVELMKQLDPTRPCFISQRGHDVIPQVDFNDYHYPSLGEIKQIAAKPAPSTPFVITEGPHVFCIPGGLIYDYGEKDYWGTDLANQWQLLWDSPTALGGFIWEWQDQGLADKFPDKDRANGETAALAGTEADTGGGSGGGTVFGDSVPLRNNNHKGIVDGYRNPKPEIWNVKMVYSPVVIDSRNVPTMDGQYVISLKNRYSFTDLSELTCHWEALKEGNVLSCGDTHFACPPLSSTQARIASVPGGQILHLQFIHPDGRIVYSARLQTPEAKPSTPPPPLASTGPIGTTDAGGNLVFHTADTVVTINKGTGQFTWQASNQNLVDSGPVFNLGQGHVYHNEFSKSKKGEPPIPPVVQSKEAPILKNVSVTAAGQNDAQVVTVDSDVYLKESKDLQGHLTNTFTIFPNARIDVAWQFAWKTADHDVFEIGMTLAVANTLDTLSWSRQAQWTDYPVGHIGAPEGTVKNDSLSFRCTKRNLNWATLSGNQPLGLSFTPAGTSLQFRGRPDNTIFLSSQVGPPREFSTNLVSDDIIRLTKDHPLKGSFEVAVVRPNSH